MEEKTKLYGGLLLCIFLTTLFVGYVIGYSVGYHEAEELYEDSLKGCNDALEECNSGYGRCIDLVEKCSDTLNKCNKQLKKDEVNYKHESLEKGYDNTWCLTNCSRRAICEGLWSFNSSIWVCYTENYTGEQMFNEQIYTQYDGFSGCYIWRQD